MGLCGGDSQGPSAGETGLAEVATRQWNEFAKPLLTEIGPMQAARVKDRNYRRGIELGDSAAVTSQAFDRAGKRSRAGLSSRGFSPNSGKAKMAMLERGTGRAEALGLGLTGAQLSRADRYASELHGGASQNLGIASSGVSGLSASAQLQNQAQMAEQRAAQTEAAGFGKGVGTAVGLYGQQLLKKDTAKSEQFDPSVYEYERRPGPYGYGY